MSSIGDDLTRYILLLALMDSFVAKIYGLTIMAKTPHSGSISFFFSKFEANLFINGTNCHNFVFSWQKYWCSTSKFLYVP